MELPRSQTAIRQVEALYANVGYFDMYGGSVLQFVGYTMVVTFALFSRRRCSSGKRLRPIG